MMCSGDGFPDNAEFVSVPACLFYFPGARSTGDLAIFLRFSRN